MNAREEGERALVAADGFLVDGKREEAAAALNRAHGLLPEDEPIARQRRAILDELSLEEHGLVWRYVPAGTFLMGSKSGDADERPVHPRYVEAFWMTDIPLTWAAYCRLLNWEEPPRAWPRDGDPSTARTERAGLSPAFVLNELTKIRRQYCETLTARARDWHDHADDARAGGLMYDRKPLIAVSAYEAEELAAALTNGAVTYGLPTEAEWEKAARGGLIGGRWSWGDEPPTHARCDFDRFGAFHLEDPRTFAANGYGLHSMCGGVAEWTADRYDALAYHRAASKAAPEPIETQNLETRVIRGGSWADCAEAVTVSFRAGRAQGSWRHPDAGQTWGAPTVGFRLVRRANR